MRMVLVPLLIAVFVTCRASSGADPLTRVPPWNTRGVGLLPRQAIACVDVAGDGTIIVGTIAPAGQPNVMVLDSAGKLTVSIQDRQGNVSRIERTFSVGG